MGSELRGELKNGLMDELKNKLKYELRSEVRDELRNELRDKLKNGLTDLKVLVTVGARAFLLKEINKALNWSKPFISLNHC